MARLFSSLWWLLLTAIFIAIAAMVLVYERSGGRVAMIDGHRYRIPPEYPGGQYGIPDNTRFSTAVMWPSMEPYSKERASSVRTGECGVIEIMVSGSNKDIGGIDYFNLTRESANRLHGELRQVGKYHDFEVFDMVLPKDVGNKRYLYKVMNGVAVERIECSAPITGKTQTCNDDYFYKQKILIGLGYRASCLSQLDSIKIRVHGMIDSFEIYRD